MKTIGKRVKNRKRSVCYEARGRVFESPRANVVAVANKNCKVTKSEDARLVSGKRPMARNRKEVAILRTRGLQEISKLLKPGLNLGPRGIRTKAKHPALRVVLGSDDLHQVCGRK